MNLDVAPQYLKPTQARFVKNLYYQLTDFGDAQDSKGSNTGVQKPLTSNEIYYPYTLPSGNNHVIGVLPSIQTSELYVFVYNSLSNHFIFRVNGDQRTIDALAPSSCFNFQLKPEYFIGEGQCHIEISYVPNPDTGEVETKKDLYWTDGFNYQGFLRFDDYLATNGFDENSFNYFIGDYDKCQMLRMGIPTPSDCIKIEQVPFDITTDIGKNNNINYSSWQFRILFIDVFGRPSEHGMISDLFYLSNNSCLSASDMLSRCVNLTFDAGNPLVDNIQIEYRNCNDTQWYLDYVLPLYNGSNLSEWWLRERNQDVNYNATTNEITYKFCKDKLCDPIDPTETRRTEPQLPRVSQAIAKVGSDIALANNLYGFPPFSKKDILDKLSATVTNPVASKIGDTANITILIKIYNPYGIASSTYQKVWLQGTTYVYGGIDIFNTGTVNIKSDYQQYFAVPGQKGYIGYLAGTDNYAIGVQYHLEKGVLVEDNDFTQINDGQYFLQFKFNSVPKSKYIFAIAASTADPTVVDIKTTSTPVAGIYNFSNYNVGSLISHQIKELVIDVCNEDYDSLISGQILLTYDLTNPLLGGSSTTVVSGYIYENTDPTTGLNVLPVPLLQVNVYTGGDRVVNCLNTDRNGFYFASASGVSSHSPGNVQFIISVIGYCNCLKKELIRMSFGKLMKLYTKDLVLGIPALSPVTNSCTDFETYPCSRVIIKGFLKLCNSDIGVPNVNIVLSRGGTASTGSDGSFSLFAYDDILGGSNIDQLYIMGGSCSFTSCDGNCFEIINVTFNPCTVCQTRNVDVGTTNVLYISNKGLLSGGRYGIALFGYDWVGRHNFAQTTDKLYFNIPTLNQTQTFGFSSVALNIPNNITFPDWVDYLVVGITIELNYGGNYIDWIADKVTFVDNSGVENNAAPTQIRIDYGSLNQFNANNNFNTTTGWQITPESSTSPRTADIVQILRNGDGTWLDSPVTSLVKYDQTGQYFLINYSASLSNLKENALIRLANPQDCTNKDQFFTLCGKIKVINGKAQSNSILLNAFDTYYQYRQIPVPVTVTTGTPPVSSTIIELRQFGFPFESPSITDTWGKNCWNIGSFEVQNPYENEIISRDQVALSGAVTPNNQLNYLNYFDSSHMVTFNINDTGGIVYLGVKTGVVFVLCQFKNFLVGYGDNEARMNESGLVYIPSGEDTFGKPERALSGFYGCQFFDKNTIREKDGSIVWLDRTRTAILQNDVQSSRFMKVQQTTDVSRFNPSDSTIVSWLTSKIKFQQQYNAANPNSIRYFHSVVNPSNMEWLLSEFTIGGNTFVNTERDIDVTQQETISFDTVKKVWKTFLSPTPELFGYLEGSNIGQLLFTFQNGVAFSNTGNTFNTFFGIPCESIYRYIFNTDGFKKKKFQSMLVYSPDKLLWSDQVLTGKQKSRLLKVMFKKQDYFYSAPFLCDITNNIPNAITDSDNLFDSYVDVRLIGDADGLYYELYGVEITAAPDEQSGS